VKNLIFFFYVQIKWFKSLFIEKKKIMNFGKKNKKYLQWNNWVQIIKKIKIQPANQEATRVTALSHHTFSLRVVCHGRALSARVMHAPGLANGNAPHVPSGQTFNLFKPFITSFLFSHFQQPTPMVSTYWKWLSISHCRWSYVHWFLSL